MDDLKCCGTCKWHFYKSTNEDFACINKESEYYTDFTNYNDTCPDWEEK